MSRQALADQYYPYKRLLIALGFNPPKLGCCAGVAVSFVLSEVIGERDVYCSRSKFIIELENSLGSGIGKLNESKSDNKNVVDNKVETKKEHKEVKDTLINILSFFNIVMCFQSPENLPFSVPGVLGQGDILAMSKIMASFELEQKRGLFLLYQDSALYSKSELCNYLEHLRLLFKKGNKKEFRLAVNISIPFNLNGKDIGHVMSLAYDELNDHWILLDPAIALPKNFNDMTQIEANKFFDQRDGELLPNAYIKNGNFISLWLEKYFISSTIYLGLHVQVFTAGSHPKLTQLQNDFKKFKASIPSGCPSNIAMASRIAQDGNALIHVASRNGDVEKLRVLKDLKANFKLSNKNYFTPVYIASGVNYDSLKFFIEEKANLDIATDLGFTPAMGVVKSGGHLQLIALAKAGANLTLTNPQDDDNALIHYATYYNIKALRLLGNSEFKTVNLNQTNAYGATAAHCAAIKDLSEEILVLNELGVNLEMLTYEGRFAPIHLAAKLGNLKALKALIDCKVNLDLEDKEFGCTAAFMAACNNQQTVLQLLQKSGAEIDKKSQEIKTTVNTKPVLFSKPENKKRRSFYLGQNDFKNLVTIEDCKLIDKSLLIKEIFDDKSQTIVIARPSGFGKTVNLGMLRYFFDPDYCPGDNLFNSLEIAKYKSYLNQQGQYPVVYITFSTFDSYSFDEAFDRIYILLSEVYRKNRPRLEKYLHDKKEEKQYYEKIIEHEQIDKNEKILSLRKLTEYLSKAFDRKVILLVDAYDNPIFQGHSKNHGKKITEFLQELYLAVLKDNPYLAKAVFTGNLPIKELFLGLPHIEFYNKLSDRYGPYYGFSHEEAKKILEDVFPSYFEEVKYWYGGLQNGLQSDNNLFFNPVVLINFIIDNQKLALTDYGWYHRDYYARDVVEKLLDTAPQELKEKFSDLLENKPVIAAIDEFACFAHSQKSASVWGFLVLLGYLSAKPHLAGTSNPCDIWIPNKMLFLFFEEIVRKWHPSKLRKYEFKSQAHGVFNSSCGLDDTPKEQISKTCAIL